MYIETLAKQGKTYMNEGLAAIDHSKLVGLRKDQLRNCFMNEMELGSRFQTIAKIHGTEYISDFRSTSINATWYALELMQNPVVWIAHAACFSEQAKSLVEIVKDKVDWIVSIGKVSEMTRSIFVGEVKEFFHVESIEEAVQSAYSLAEEGNAVLYSPACMLEGGNEVSAVVFRESVNKL